MTDHTRPIGWVRAARKAHAAFLVPVQDRANSALTIVAEGSGTDIAKPLKGFGLSVWQIAVRYRTDAYRAIYIAEMSGSLWVIHAFKKKSKVGVKTPKTEIEVARKRLARLRKELLK